MNMQSHILKHGKTDKTKTDLRLK